MKQCTWPDKLHAKVISCQLQGHKNTAENPHLWHICHVCKPGFAAQRALPEDVTEYRDNVWLEWEEGRHGPLPFGWNVIE